MGEPDRSQPLVSIVMVNYKVPDYAVQSIRSIHEANYADRCEIIVVDNASMDNSQTKITAGNQDVKWIGLKNNIGFGKASNVGAQNASGKYILLLNPDTIISHNSISACADFLDAHPDTGLAGPKILGPEGKLQRGCRRSFPTPFNSFCHLFGLSAVFPKSRLFGAYNLTYLKEDEASEVDAISGSFMFIRASVFRDIGGFDEAFFMYGEDLDLCARVKRSGSSVWYLPQSQIVHFHGRSSAKSFFRTRIAFYEAMVIFSRKYRGSYGSFFPAWLIYAGIFVQASVRIAATLAGSLTACLTDLLIVNIVLAAGIAFRFSLASIESPYSSHDGILSMIGMHSLMSASFFITLALRGVYFKSRYSPGNALLSGLIASAVFLTGIYFTQIMAFSRIAFAFSAFISTFALVAWREILSGIKSGTWMSAYVTGRVIVVGDNDTARKLIKNTENDKTAKLIGVIWPGRENPPGQFEGYPILGTLPSLSEILRDNRASLLLVATKEPWYSYFIESLPILRRRHLSVKWVKPELLTQKPETLSADIPLEDFHV